MGVAVTEGVRKTKGTPQADLERAYPSLSTLAGPTGRATQQAWVAVFNARPDAMASLLADFIKHVHAKPGRIGQRPMPREEQVDLEGLIYGEENNEPLAKVLPGLVKVSERQFCLDIHMSRAQYWRMLRGEYDPDVNELRLIAKAVGKPATYFVEYRTAMVIAAMLAMFEQRPGIVTALYRQYLEVRM